MTVRLLVVDDDPWMQRLTSLALADMSIEISAATDGTIALAKALANPPDIILSDVMMPGMDGWSLVRRIRSHAQLAFIPFIFLTALKSSDDVLRGFRLGADDFLSKPFKPEELRARVEHALHSRHTVETDVRAQVGGLSPSGPGFRGTLQDLGISSLLVLLEIERKTGMLTVKHENGRDHCRLYLRDGRVVSAHDNDERSLTGAPVVWHVLNWARGGFAFNALPVEMPDEVGMTTTHLLMEGARRMDETVRPALA
jgi:CheY-like chemotaxis protein